MESNVYVSVDIKANSWYRGNRYQESLFSGNMYMYERIIFKEDCVFLILLKYIKIYIASNESISFFISSYKFAILKKMNKIVAFFLEVYINLMFRWNKFSICRIIFTLDNDSSFLQILEII